MLPLRSHQALVVLSRLDPANSCRRDQCCRSVHFQLVFPWLQRGISMEDGKTSPTLSNDAPIQFPSEDLFGLDPFARALANSIASMAAPDGMVLAINGTWGSGKSSAINLVRHHLSETFKEGKIVPVTFNPWWFAGSDSITLAFFQELKSAIGPSLSSRARKALSAIGQQVSSIGSFAGALGNLKFPGLGSAISFGSKWVGDISKRTKTVEQEHKEVSEALANQDKLFLVIIDDIDRLSPDDALTMFRLVKSVGRLPRVIYLLAFDRALAERAASEKFPSEGAAYLEKIVQTSFDISPPRPDELRNRLLNAAIIIVGQPSNSDAVRFMNVYIDVVCPIIHTPRDITRLANDLIATWPSVSGEVDKADFIALAAIRLFAPEIYFSIQRNPEKLCGVRERHGYREDNIQQQYDDLFQLNSFGDDEKQEWRQALRRLFPRLDSIWSNTWHSDDDSYRRRRLLCSKEHFRTYFALSHSHDVFGAKELNEIILLADDEGRIKEAFAANLAIKLPEGRTRASLLLEELTVHASQMQKDKVPQFVKTLFSIADSLDVPDDESRGFNIANNYFRIHWLLNRLVQDRFSILNRDLIYKAACESAQMGWLLDFSDLCSNQYKPADGERRYGDPIVSSEVSEELTALSLERLRDAAANPTIIYNRRISRLLIRWSQLSPRGGSEVREWTDIKLRDDEFVIAMAKSIPAITWSQGLGFDGMGDHVAQSSFRVNLEFYATILDTELLEARVDELLSKTMLDSAHREALNLFKSAHREAREIVEQAPTA